jgi:hypothetical protein
MRNKQELYASNDKEEFDVCCVCLDDFYTEESVKKLNCGHVLHVNCLAMFVASSQGKCPLCRVSLCGTDVFI